MSTADKRNEQNQEEDLFYVRPSVPLDSSNAKFFLSEGNLISMDLIKEDGTVEHFERVIPIRAFPISNPDEFICIREPDIKDKGHGDEIGMIRHLTDVDEESQKLIQKELASRYTTPAITKINGIKEKFGYAYWEVETDSGKLSFVMTNMYRNIRTMEDNRVYITDIDGNVFTIPNPDKLDKNSYHRIEIYL